MSGPAAPAGPGRGPDPGAAVGEVPSQQELDLGPLMRRAGLGGRPTWPQRRARSPPRSTRPRPRRSRPSARRSRHNPATWSPGPGSTSRSPSLAPPKHLHRRRPQPEFPTPPRPVPKPRRTAGNQRAQSPTEGWPMDGSRALGRGPSGRPAPPRENITLHSSGSSETDSKLTRMTAMGKLLSSSSPGAKGLNTSTVARTGKWGSARRTRPKG